MVIQNSCYNNLIIDGIYNKIVNSSLVTTDI